MARAKHTPTEATRKTVELHASVGTPQELIAELVGVDAKTLRLRYRKELDLGLSKANAVVGGKLFAKAVGDPKDYKTGDTTACIFWLKCRAGWKEKIEIDLSKLSPEQLVALMEMMG